MFVIGVDNLMTEEIKALLGIGVMLVALIIIEIILLKDGKGEKK